MVSASRLSNYLAAFLPLLLSVPPPGAADESPAVPLEAILQQVPETKTELLERNELVEARLAELNRDAEGDRVFSDEDARAVQSARLELARFWRTYRENLHRFTTLRENLASVTSPQQLQALSDELSALEEETSKWKRAAVPAAPSEAQIAELKTRASTLKAQIETLAESNRQRAKHASEGVQSQERPLLEELQQIRSRREQVLRQLAEPAVRPDGSASKKLLQVEKERLTVNQALVQLALQELKPAAEFARHAFEQGERRLGAMRALLSALEARVNAMNEASTQARLKELEVTETRSPTEAALRNLKLFSERVLLAYFQDPEQLRRRQERFTQRAADRQHSRLQLAVAYWSRVRESSEYQNAAELASFREELRKVIEDERAQLDTLRAKSSKTLDELRHLQTVRDRALERFNALADQVITTVDRNDLENRTRVQTTITTARSAFVESMGTAISSVEEVSTRIEHAIDLAESHRDQLTSVSETLRWQRITKRDSGLWASDWASAWGEVTALWRPLPGAAVEHREDGSAAALNRELFGDGRDNHKEWRRLGGRIAGSVRGVTSRQWTWTLIGIVVAAAAGLATHRTTRRRGVRLAREIVAHLEIGRDEEHPIRSGLSARINLMVLNMLGDLAIPVLVTAALLLAVWWADMDESITAIAAAPLGTVVVAVALLRLAHHLFEAESPPHRPIPCSDNVARHYRKWIGLMIVFSLAALILPITLRVAGVAPTLQSVLWELYKTGLLLLFVVFLFRKERVLGLGDLGTLNWGLMFTWIAYPLLVLAVAVLLVLEVIGYGELVGYVGSGLLLSFAVLIVLGTVIEYLNDLMERRSRQWQTPGDTTTAPFAAGSARNALEAQRSLYLIALLRWLVRIAGVAVIAFLILRVWNVPIQSPTMNWRGIGLVLLSILLALLLDRLVLTVLSTLSATGRMPESTVGIIQRWLRGVLAIVVVLAAIAVAGFDVRSLWTLLATFLAMVAVGFVAVWSILSNVLATIVILVWRPFDVGEHITILPEDVAGEVVDINFMYTTLKSQDGTRMSIPNNLFAQKFIRRKGVKGRPQRTLAEQLDSEKPLGE